VKVERLGENVTLYLGDCLDILPGLSGVDAVITDPPYYKIMSDAWDRQWNSVEEYADWLQGVGVEIKKTMKSNGSFLLFGDDKNIAYVQVKMDKVFTLLSCMVWHKTNSQMSRGIANLRTFAPMTERILFYTPQLCQTGLETVKLDINNFQSLREYFKQYQEAIGQTKKAIIDKIGQQADHCFRWNSSQWDLPTKETYQALALAFPVKDFKRREYEDLRREYEDLRREYEDLRREYEDLRREYEDLRREYEDLRREYEDLRRVFNATKDTTDVIKHPIVSQADNTKHPTTKPVGLIGKLIMATTNPGFTVMDCFMGSGTTGVACIRTGRKFIGIEKDPQYFDIACKRINEELKQGRLFDAA
jgi:site-specific DNA-methyltransferase (adenine-specific)